MALIPVKPHELAAVITYCEMARRPKPRPMQTSPLRLVRWHNPAPEKYRILFRRVGEPWLWFSRLAIDDDALCAILADSLIEIYAVLDPKGIEIGLIELDFREPGRCEIAFFALVQQLIGQGLGNWMMAQTVSLGWRNGIERITVQTSSLDDPRALSTYLKAGFTIVGRAIETFADPRIEGLLPKEAAPHVPMIKTRGL